MPFAAIGTAGQKLTFFPETLLLQLAQLQKAFMLRGQSLLVSAF